MTSNPIFSQKRTNISDDTKTCPFCAETIKAAAIVCRFCGRELSESSMTDPLAEKKQKLRTELQQKIEYLENELVTYQTKLDERRRMWNSEYDGMKGAEGIDRGIQTVIAPLSSLFRGKKKYTEEFRSQSVNEFMEKDVNVKAIRLNISLTERQIHVYTGWLDKLVRDTLSPEEIDGYLKKIG